MREGRAVGDKRKSHIRDNPKSDTFSLSLKAHLSALLEHPTERKGCADVRMGDQDVVEALAVLRPLAIGPYRRLGLRQAPEPAPQRLLPATVEVERRPLSVYAEALQ